MIKEIKISKKLNLGCGEFKKEGFINVDFFSVSKPDVIHNLNVFPYPFNENEFSYVEANHVLEHLQDPFAVMREIHRITQQGGIVIIRVPHFSRGFIHPEHKRGFDVSFPYYFKLISSKPPTKKHQNREQIIGEALAKKSIIFPKYKAE